MALKVLLALGGAALAALALLLSLPDTSSDREAAFQPIQLRESEDRGDDPRRTNRRTSKERADRRDRDRGVARPPRAPEPPPAPAQPAPVPEPQPTSPAPAPPAPAPPVQPDDDGFEADDGGGDDEREADDD